MITPDDIPDYINNLEKYRSSATTCTDEVCLDFAFSILLHRLHRMILSRVSYAEVTSPDIQRQYLRYLLDVVYLGSSSSLIMDRATHLFEEFANQGSFVTSESYLETLLQYLSEMAPPIFLNVFLSELNQNVNLNVISRLVCRVIVSDRTVLWMVFRCRDR